MFDPKISFDDLPILPGNFEYDQKNLLKIALEATEEISKLNGLSYLVPNLDILIAPLLAKESVESNAIENINTTTLKVLQAGALENKFIGGPEKEVLHYREAILKGFANIKKYSGIGYNSIVELQSVIEKNKPGIRKIPGTVIVNGYKEIVYTPPNGQENIVKLLTNLENFINDFSDNINPLIKMPVLHYQFESIHPFLDGNGRTGRILNILYLVLAEKLEYPILFLSEYINNSKNDYYEILGKTHKTGDYSEIIIYLLKGIISESKKTSEKIIKINKLISEKELEISSKTNIDYRKITMILFSNPFISLTQLEKKYETSRITISRYVSKLEEEKIISSVKIGRQKLIFIPEFIELLS